MESLPIKHDWLKHKLHNILLAKAIVSYMSFCQRLLGGDRVWRRYSRCLVVYLNVWLSVPPCPKPIEKHCK